MGIAKIIVAQTLLHAINISENKGFSRARTISD